MANKKNLTAFQKLDGALTGNWGDIQPQSHVNKYDMSNGSSVIFRTNDKAEYDKAKLELQQNKYLKDLWVKSNIDLSVGAFSNLNYIQLMYRDADLMDAFPEIGAALDTYAEESCLPSPQEGTIVNVYSKSDRIRYILEDLFVNRLNIQITAPMIVRALCKYGNQFMLLNVDNKLGVKGWRQLPVFDVERIENGIQNPYSNCGISISVNNTNKDVSEDDLGTMFVWNTEQSSQKPFRNWQVAHFRLLNNSMYLPYGCSVLNSARRHFRMLSLMEDMMFIYRLERSMERRVYKIFVGAIDEADVEGYVEQIANRFKRTPIVDPMTGQIDLRKNILSIDNDIFIPTRSENAPTPIDTLSAGQNLTAMDDIKFVQNKLATALRIPKAFMNFEEAAGDGKNLALMDVRFTRIINHIQQAFLMELTKVASIHLYLLGFGDDITNFSLTMNNPSTQAEQLEIENLQKKIAACRDAISDPGNGIPIMSQMRALKEIMKWSDKEIKENLEEIRLERAIATELEKTSQIIKRTKLFDNVDRIYGESGAEYIDDQQMGQGQDMGGLGGGMPGGGGADFGGGLDALGMPGGDENGDINGQQGAEPTAEMGGGSEPTKPEQPMESKNVALGKLDKLFENYVASVKQNMKDKHIVSNRADIFDKSLMINEEFNKMIELLDDYKKD